MYAIIVPSQPFSHYLIKFRAVFSCRVEMTMSKYCDWMNKCRQKLKSAWAGTKDLIFMDKWTHIIYA